MTTLSIVIPAYNSEHSIQRTLDSISNLQYKDYEVIIIDDGSIDSTPSILKRVAKENQKIKFFQNNDNKGVSYTRNFGIQQASGEYLTFIDAGDTIDKECYQFLKDSDSYDAYMFELYRVEGSKKIYKQLPFPAGLYNYDFIIEHIIPLMIAPLKSDNLNEPVMGSVCRLVIRKNIVLNNNISFDKDVRIAEDLLFCIDVLSKMNFLSVIKKPYYNYIREENSSIEKYYNNNFEKSITFSKLLDSRMKNIYRNNYNIIDKRFQVYRFYLCTWEISAIARSNLNYREKMHRISKVMTFFKENSFTMRIYKELNNSRKIAFLFFKINSKMLLYICFKIKEHLRIKRYNS